jgi:hypothetical protein
MVATVARVYDAVPADVRPRTAIFARNYSQAGAVDLLGPRYGLPKAISGHQNYYLWGPRDYTGESVIVLGDQREDLEKLFQSVRKVARVEHPYSMPYNHFDVFYCRGMRLPLKDYWPHVKSWD